VYLKLVIVLGVTAQRVLGHQRTGDLFVVGLDKDAVFHGKSALLPVEL
jgi:hypothetical protein